MSLTFRCFPRTAEELVATAARLDSLWLALGARGVQKPSLDEEIAAKRRAGMLLVEAAE